MRRPAVIVSIGEPPGLERERRLLREDMFDGWLRSGELLQRGDVQGGLLCRDA